MDSLTHALVGGYIGSSISLYVSGSIEPVFVFGAIMAGELADGDMIHSIKNKAKKMKYHRSITHSFFCMPIICGLFALLISLVFQESFRLIYIIIFFAYFSHILLDLLNSYGTKIWLPFSKKRYAFDILPIWDLWLVIMFLVGYLFLPIGISYSVLWVTFALFCYILFRIIIKQHYKKELIRKQNFMKVTLLPKQNPVQWDFIAERGEYYILGSIYGLKKKTEINEILLYPIDEIIKAHSEEVRLFLEFSRFPYCYPKKERGKVIYYWTDLRYRLQHKSKKNEWK